MAALRRRFLEQAIADADAIERHAAADAWLAVRDLSHGIAGRAGMFGFASLTDDARCLEESIDAGAGKRRLHEMTTALVSTLRSINE